MKRGKSFANLDEAEDVEGVQKKAKPEAVAYTLEVQTVTDNTVKAVVDILEAQTVADNTELKTVADILDRGSGILEGYKTVVHHMSKEDESSEAGGHKGEILDSGTMEPISNDDAAEAKADSPPLAAPVPTAVNKSLIEILKDYNSQGDFADSQ